ncbi:hypothetical protein [Chlamydia pecorum]|uniref:hypothetical protein n=1 Tax=Chlamydia pecorum TaxID=85991 RepID=UPI000307438E|nr:hypothetical protein [Chlamydia pecorum]ETF37412.1 hypothetical protein CpecS_0606 [Chlamydia pecorum VR629]ETF37918.1 hypothetical protein CpecF_0604 [Chlamydia pecorum DBDeUG]ETF38185.1 hypothetical protein CpecG_0602 [Chlamydia pecorum MC/MarsBar]ETF40155.1 hypothetical protein CpecA_0603 [Chlamydia pecorum IPTaLE]UBV32174.1 hypothetical protein MarsBar_0614 [Chlamydia pecorum]
MSIASGGYALTPLPKENSFFKVNKNATVIQKKVDILINRSLNTYAFAIALLILITLGGVAITCLGYYTQNILEIASGIVLAVIAITCIVVFSSLVEWVNILPSAAERSLTLIKSKASSSQSIQLVQEATQRLVAATLEQDNLAKKLTEQEKALRSKSSYKT